MKHRVATFEIWQRALATEWCHKDPGINVAVVDGYPWRGHATFEVLSVDRLYLLRFAHLAGVSQDVKDQLAEDGVGAPFAMVKVGGLRTEGVWRYVDRRKNAAEAYERLRRAH